MSEIVVGTIAGIAGQGTRVSVETVSREVRRGSQLQVVEHPVVTVNAQDVAGRFFSLPELLDPSKSYINGVTRDTGIICRFITDSGTFTLEKRTNIGPAVVSRGEGDGRIDLGELLDPNVRFNFSGGMKLRMFGSQTPITIPSITRLEIAPAIMRENVNPERQSI